MSGEARFQVAEEHAVEAARFVAARRLRSWPILPIFIAMLAVLLLLVTLSGIGPGRWATLVAFLVALPLALLISNRLIVPW